MSGTFPPDEQVCTLRAYVQQRAALLLCLSPGAKISGGKVLNSATKPVANKAAAALRMAAFTLFNSKSALEFIGEGNGHDLELPRQLMPRLINWPA